MMQLIEEGCPNIIVAQPFACLPNHVVGKGVFRELRRFYPEANVVSIDYDPGASEVNQLNRIKLMISVAKENFRNGAAGGFHLENPDDPTLHENAPVADVRAHADRYGSNSITLTPEQLAQIEEAKRRAGVIK